MKPFLAFQPDRAPIEALGNLDKARIAKAEEIEKMSDLSSLYIESPVSQKIGYINGNGRSLFLSRGRKMAMNHLREQILSLQIRKIIVHMHTECMHMDGKISAKNYKNTSQVTTPCIQQGVHS